jgi:hypothetical protein
MMSSSGSPEYTPFSEITFCTTSRPLGPAFHSPGLAQRLKPARISQLLGQVQVATSTLGGELLGEAHADKILFRPPVLRT